MQEEQIAYVAGQLQNGVDERVLRNTMREHGYTDDQINELITEARRRIGPSDQQDPLSNPSENDGVAQSISLPGVFDLLNTSFTFAFKRLDLVLFGSIGQLIAMVPYLLAVGLMVYGMFGAFMGEPVVNGVLMAVLFVVGFLVMITVSVLNSGALLYSSVSREQVTYWEGIRWAWKHFWSFLWVGALVGLVSVTGFVFFFIPGVIVSVYLTLALVVLAKEEIRGMHALTRSTQLVYGNWFGVFGRLLVVLICGFIIGFLSSIVVSIISSILTVGGGFGLVFGVIVSFLVQVAVQMLLTVFSFHFLGGLYESLHTQKASSQKETKSRARVLYQVMAVFGLVAPILVGVFLAVTLASLNSARDKGEDAAIKMSINNMRAAAELHYDDNSGSYAGLCDSEYLDSTRKYTSEVDCTAIDEAYAIEVQLHDGYYCLDNTGPANSSLVSVKQDTECLSLFDPL